MRHTQLLLRVDYIESIIETATYKKKQLFGNLPISARKPDGDTKWRPVVDNKYSRRNGSIVAIF